MLYNSNKERWCVYLMNMKKYMVLISFLMFFTMCGVLLFSSITKREVHGVMAKKFVSHMVDVSKASVLAIKNDIHSVKRSLGLAGDTIAEYDFDFSDMKLEQEITHIYNSVDFLSINDIAYINEKGIVTYNLNAKHLIGKDFSFRKYFDTIREKKDPSFMEVQLIEFKGVDKGDKGLIFALGVFVKAGKSKEPVFKGVTVITSTLSSLVNKYVTPLSIGHTGYLWFFQSNGTILYHPQIFAGKTHQNILDSTKYSKSFKSAVTDIISRKALTGKYRENSEDFVYATSEVKVGSDKWFFVVSVPQKDTLAMLETYSTINLLLTTASIFAVFLFGLFLALLLYLKNQKLLKTVDVKTYELEYSKAVNEELDSVIHTIAHDLKTPLTSVMGFSDVLLTTSGDTLSENNNKYLLKIHYNANYMKNLIDSLLKFAKIGRTVNAFEKISLNDLFEDVQLQLNYMIGKHGAKINIANDLPTIKADKIKISQLFINIINNAIKFMPEDRTPEIDITCNETVRFYNILVSDNGIGIDESDYDNIFNLFHRTKDIDSQGTGVGLAIVKKIIDSHRGKISVKSDRSVGTTFTVSLRKSL
jgi:signal transduction histidine kinase